MKIAIITPVFPPTPGGIGMVAYRQAQGLAARGHQVTVFTPSRGKSLCSFPRLQHLSPILRYRHAAFVPQLLWHLRCGKFDVVHLHYPFFGAAELFLFYYLLPTTYYLLMTYHHDVVGEGLFKPLFAFHTKYIMPRILRKAHAVLVSSMDYAHHSLISSLTQGFFFSPLPSRERPASRQGEGVPIIELPFGIDTNIFSPAVRSPELSKKYGITPTDRVVLFLGGLDRAHYFKGVEVLLKASSSLYSQLTTHNYKLVIAGEGDLRPLYQQLAHNLGIAEHVIFTGYVPEQEKPTYFNLADIVVLPSIDRTEAFGVVLLEAMACGKPVIASNLPGVRSVVKHQETGLLVTPGSVESLAASLTTLLQDSALRGTMGEVARKRVEELYTQEQEIAGLERIMQQ